MLGLMAVVFEKAISLNYILKHTSIRHSFAFALFRLIIVGLVTVGQAGANPNEATRLEYDKYNNTWSFTWWGHVGSTYFIQQSDDLLSWQYMPFIIEGEDKVAEWQFSNDQNTAFVRLKYTDMPTSDPRNDDFDSDDINNWSELLQQSDPLASDDHDSNGIPDDWELFWYDQFGVFPSTVVATLTHRDSTTQQLYLNNPVSPDANFTVTLSNNLAGTQIIYDFEDNLTGGAVYNWTDISTSGTLLPDISETDNAAQEVVLNNFTFPFYETSYDQVYVASNGLLTFGSPSTDSGNDAIPYEYEPNNFIALLWDDLDTNDAIADDGGEVYFQEFADRIIVQYERVMRDSDSDRSTQSNTFQVVLHASGLIDVHYKEIGGYTGSATVGIEDSSGTNGIEVFYNGYRTIHPTFELSNGLALSYTPQSAKFVQVSPLTGTTTTGSSSTLEVNFNSYDLAPGTYVTDIEIAHSGTGTTPWIITAVLEVINTPATISITWPADGDTIWSDQSLRINVSASDDDFGIERVEFFYNETRIGEDTTPSYNYYWADPIIGSYALTARAVDPFGTVTISDPVNVTVLADSDLDRMDDAWEQQHFGSLNQEASADFDGDGVPNVFEYNHKTDPIDALSKLSFTETQTGDYKYFIVDKTLAAETAVKKKTLSAAISNANDYDVIEVHPGTYNEVLGRLNDRLYVFGAEGARNTIIDLNGLNNPRLYLYSESVFAGLTFQGANTGSSSYTGGALYLHISGKQNKPRFIGCRFIDNTVGDRGGAIYIGSGDPLFIACTIAGNLGGSGSAIYNSSSSNTITLVNTLLWNPGNSTEIDGQTASVIFDHSLARGVTTGNVLIDGVDQGTDDPGLAYDYSLAAGSIARDRGSLGAYSDYANLTDCDGEAVLATRDIGADEFIDSDGDGLPDWIELQAGIDLNATDDNDLDLLNNLEDYENMGNPFLDDTDGDGLLDGDEFYADGTHGDTDGYSTGVNNTDTDNDGMGDGWEVTYGFNPTSANAPSTDSDGDGLTDKQEFSSGGNPLSADTDNNGMSDALEYRYEMNLSTHVDSDTDGMPDDYETAFGLSPTDPSDASLDKDNDALSNLEEYQFGTQANYFDSDGDLLGDGWEVNQGLNPLSPDGIDGMHGDADGDGLNNFQEQSYRTNPSPEDTNNDGIADGYDSDGDGVGDGAEVTQGSIPNDASDGGVPPTGDEMLKVKIIIGDPSGSQSERWSVAVTDLTTNSVILNHQSPTFGELSDDQGSIFNQFRRDRSYEIKLSHIATDPGNDDPEFYPDYDWALEISVEDENGLFVDVTDSSMTEPHFLVLDPWDPSLKEISNTVKLLVDRYELEFPWEGHPDRTQQYQEQIANKRVLLLKVEFETFADDETREIGGNRSPNWKAHTLNLNTKQDEETHYGDYKKCVAHIWSNQPLNLAKYLSDYESNQEVFENPDVLNWRVDGQLQTSFELNLGERPDPNLVTKFEIEVLVKENSEPVDQLIVTVVPPETLTNFDQWSANNQDLGWLNALPAVYSIVHLDTNLDAINPEPSSLACSNWKDNKPFSMFFDMGADTYYHPDADYEIRSEEVAGGHGHQACYNQAGVLIRSGVSAGTADRAFYGNTSGANSHVNLDAIPFVWAVQLDGAPAQGEDGIFPDYSSMDNPIMHEGKFIGEYIDLRPPIANGRTELLPGNCP